MENITLCRVSSDSEIEQIISLQKQNLPSVLDDDEKSKQGFVTVQHDFQLLKKMNLAEPGIIAKSNDEVVGYALVMLEIFKSEIPVLIPMFQLFEKLTFKNLPLNHYRFFVMGQICISKSFRGLGLFDKLYETMKTELNSKFDFVITEVSQHNQRSMKAHQRVGFETIHSYSDQTDDWNILLWNWGT